MILFREKNVYTLQKELRLWIRYLVETEIRYLSYSIQVLILFLHFQTAKKLPTQILPSLRCYPLIPLLKYIMFVLWFPQYFLRYPLSYSPQYTVIIYSRNSEATEDRDYVLSATVSPVPGTQDRGQQTFFCKWPDSKYFRFCR